MRRTSKLAWTGVLSAVALVCATLTAYWTSMWWRRVKQYPELFAPICVSAVATILMLLVVAALHRGRRGRWAIARLFALLMVGCAGAASGVFFAVLEQLPIVLQNEVDGRIEKPQRAQQCHAAIGIMFFGGSLLPADFARLCREWIDKFVKNHANCI